LKDVFQGEGEIKEAIILRDALTNASRGFGFITFEDPRIAKRCVISNNYMINGKKVDVKRAEPKVY
jgi:RNA-binding protein Musashi